jgi:glutathione synthase/RimK-type ligase-like ATP-grasp enzyme
MKNTMTLKEIERFMDAKRKREAKTRENLKRIGKAAAIAAEKRDRELVKNALFCLKYGVNCA